MIDDSLSFHDALLATAHSPSLSTHVALLRARQLVGGHTFGLFGAVDAVECFNLRAHGATNGVRLLGHMHGRSWPFLAMRPASRSFCRELVQHFEVPMLFVGPASKNKTVLVESGCDEMIGAFDAVKICQAFAREFNAWAIWFSMPAQTSEEQRLTSAFDPRSVTDLDLQRVRARVHAARATEGISR